jgi:protein O-GlcNAc transferase
MDSLSEFGKVAEFIKHPLVLVGFVVMLVFSIHKLILKAKLLKELNQQQSSFVVVLLLRYGFWLGVLIMLLGFGLQFYQTYADKEIKKAANYNIEKIVANLTEKSQQDSETIKNLTKALTNLSEGKVIGSDAQIKAAFQALEKGDLNLAKQRFEETAKQGEQNIKQVTNQLEQENKQTAEAYRNLGALAFLDDTQQALQAYQRATQLDPDNADSWNYLGLLLQRIGELDQAIAAYQKVLGLGEKQQDQEKIAWAYGNLGIVYKTRGELEKAIEFFEKILKTHEELGLKKDVARDYDNLGIIYKTRGEFKKAIEFHNKALEINQNLDSKEGMAINYGNLGNVYYSRREFEKAIEFHNKALEINQNLGRKEGMAINYGNLGSAYGIRGELEKSIEFYNKALEIDQSMGNKQGIAEDFANLGSVYKIKGNKNEAKRYWKMSLELYKYIGSPMEKTVQSWLDKLESSS